MKQKAPLIILYESAQVIRLSFKVLLELPDNSSSDAMLKSYPIFKLLLFSDMQNDHLKVSVEIQIVSSQIRI